jgi:hypothetical protein
VAILHHSARHHDLSSFGDLWSVFVSPGDWTVSVDSVDTWFFSLFWFVDIAFFFWETGFTKKSGGSIPDAMSYFEIEVRSLFGEFLILDLTGDLTSVVDAEVVSLWFSAGFALFMTCVFLVLEDFVEGCVCSAGLGDDGVSSVIVLADSRTVVFFFLVDFVGGGLDLLSGVWGSDHSYDG